MNVVSLYTSLSVADGLFDSQYLNKLSNDSVVTEIQQFFIAGIEGCGNKDEYLRRFSLYAVRIGDKRFTELWQEFRADRQRMLADLEKFCAEGVSAYPHPDAYAAKLKYFQDRIPGKEFSRIWYANQLKHLSS